MSSLIAKEAENVLHLLNLDRPDIAELPEGASIVCNISTLRKAAAFIRLIREHEARTVERVEQSISFLRSRLELYGNTLDENKAAWADTLLDHINAIDGAISTPQPTAKESGDV